MKYQIVEKETKFSPDKRAATVVIESTNHDWPRAIEDLNDSRAIDFAVEFASSQGMPSPRPNKAHNAAYPVNQNGERITDLLNKGVPPKSPEAMIACYRADISLIAPLI